MEKEGWMISHNTGNNTEKGKEASLVVSVSSFSIVELKIANVVGSVHLFQLYDCLAGSVKIRKTPAVLN